MNTESPTSDIETLTQLAEQVKLSPATPTGAPISTPAEQPALLATPTTVFVDPMFTSTPEPAKDAPIRQPVPPGSLPVAPPNPTLPQPVVPPIQPPTPPPAPSLPHLTTLRVLFTGRSKVGKDWLAHEIGAKVFSLSDPALVILENAFLDLTVPPAQRLRPDFSGALAEFMAYGEGTVSPAYPLTPARAFVITNVRASGKDGEKLFGIDPKRFGHKDFWLNSLTARIVRHTAKNPNERLAITQVETPAFYTHLTKQLNFKPYHVMASNVTVASRPATGSPEATTKPTVSEMIEQDVNRKVSAQREGPKLWCIWNDPTQPCPTGRLMSVDEFRSAV